MERRTRFHPNVTPRLTRYTHVQIGTENDTRTRRHKKHYPRKGDGLGEDASNISDEDIIPATGALDSAAILALVVWYEETYDFPLKQEEINIDNLGSITAMADFLLSRKSG